MENEMRLIDVLPLMRDGWHLVRTGESNRFLASMSLADVPTVDAMEVADFNAIVEKLECLLCHATGSKYSKVGYSWEDMQRMGTDYIEECCEEAVDEAVVHSWWEKYTEGYVTCHQCCANVAIFSGHKNYCPNCGAKMDGERKDHG